MATRSTEQMATGAPNPASASKTAPKQNAMIRPWIRWSVLTATNDRLITSNAPDFTVMLWIQIAFTTIHIAGNRPNAAPSRAESPAWSAGIRYTTRATAKASANPITEAIQAFSFRPPSRTNSTRSGKAASRAESHRLPTGATCCWYIAVSMTVGSDGSYYGPTTTVVNATRRTDKLGAPQTARASRRVDVDAERHAG